MARRRRILLIALLVVAGFAGAFYGGLLEFAPSCYLQVTTSNLNPPTVNALIPFAGGQCAHIAKSILDEGATSTTFNWGDGTSMFVRGASGRGIEATHIYASVGTYDVVAVVESALGSRLDTLSAQAILVAVPLEIDWSYLVFDKTVTFTASAIGGVRPYNYNWDYGDGTWEDVATEQVTHTYAVYGTYQVKLQVTDSSTPSFQTKALGKPVELAGPATPQVTFAWTADQWSVSFTASVAGGTAPYNYAWNFGNGKLGVGATTSQTYNADGTYTVTVTVTDTNGIKSSAQEPVTVLCTSTECKPPPPPPPDFCDENPTDPACVTPALPFGLIIGFALLAVSIALVVVGFRTHGIRRYVTVPGGLALLILAIFMLLGLVML